MRARADSRISFRTPSPLPPRPHLSVATVKRFYIFVGRARRTPEKRAWRIKWKTTRNVTGHYNTLLYRGRVVLWVVLLLRRITFLSLIFSLRVYTHAHVYMYTVVNRNEWLKTRYLSYFYFRVLTGLNISGKKLSRQKEFSIVPRGLIINVWSTRRAPPVKSVGLYNVYISASSPEYFRRAAVEYRRVLIYNHCCYAEYDFPVIRRRLFDCCRRRCFVQNTYII